MGGIVKEAASVNWNYIERAITAVSLIGVQQNTLKAKPLIGRRICGSGPEISAYTLNWLK